MNRPQRQSAFPVALAYGALVVFFFAPHLLRLATFPDGDFTQHFLPFSLFQQDALLGGRLPVWDPYTNAGHPFLADAQSAVFYPISNALLLLTGFERSATGRLFWLQVEAALHLFLACAFTYLLVRRLTGQRMAAFAAGLVFGFSGFLTGYPPLQLGVLRTAVWLPLILLLLLPCRVGVCACSGQPQGLPLQGRSCFNRWRRWLMAAAVHAVAFYAGHPQTFLFLSYAVGGWMLALGVVESRHQGSGRADRSAVIARAFDFGRSLQFVGRVIAYIAVLIVLSLAQLWPALEFTGLSVRSSLPYHKLSGGFPLEDTWQLLLPGILTQFSPQYVSIAGLGLVLMAVASLLSPGFLSALSPRICGDSFARPAAFFFLICGGVALLLSYGENGPIYPLFYRYAPGGFLFRGQERAAYLVAFSLSVLSGYGLALLPSLTARWRKSLSWGFLATVGLSVVVFFLLWQLPARVDASSSGFLLLSGKTVLFAAAFAYLCGAERLSRTRLLLLFPVLVVDLFIANYTTNLANGPAIRAALASPEAAATLRAARAATERDALPPRVYNEFRLPESSGLFNGWEDVWGSSPLRLSTYNALFVDFPLGQMWQLTGIGTVLTWRKELFVESHIVAEFSREEGDTTYLHHLNSVSPRLWWAQKVRQADDETARALLGDHSFDPRSEILIAADHAATLGDGWRDGRLTFGTGGTASLHAEGIGPAQMRIRIESSQPGLLFISENWMPGWRAVWKPVTGGRSNDAAMPKNGEVAPSELPVPRTDHKLPVLRAHHAFLGVPVPAGVGTLELAYRPSSVRWGLAISGIGWAGLLFAIRHPLILAVQRAWRRSWAFVKNQWRSSSPDSSERIEVGGARSLLTPILFPRAGILLILLLGFALRLFRLDFQELRGDEAFGYFFSLNSFATIVQDTLSLREPHPVGSYFLQRVWYAVSGSSEFALRLLPALAGTAAIALVYRLARQLRLGASVALLGSFLMAVNAYAVWHSQDVRMYTLSLALTTASTALALEIIRRPTWRAVAGYILCTVMTLHTHYFAVFVLLAQNLYALSQLLTTRERHLRQPLLSRWIGVQSAVAALYTPWVIVAWQTLVGYHGNGDSPALGAMLWRSLGVLALGESVPDKIWQFDGGVLSVGVIVAGILSGLFAARRNTTTNHRPQAMVLLLVYLFVPLLAIWGSALERPIFDERYLIAALPPFLLMLAVGVVRTGNRVEQWLGWRWRSWAADPCIDGPTILAKIPIGHVAAICLVLVIVAGNLFSLRTHYFDPAFSKTLGWRELAATLERWSSGLPVADVRIARNFPDAVLWYYYTGEIGHLVLPPGPHDAEGAVTAVEALRDAGVRRILLPVQLASNWDATGIAQDALSTTYRLAAQDSVGSWPLQLYTRPDTQGWRRLDVAFTNGLTLARAQIAPDTLPAGGILTVHLDWTGDPTSLSGGEKLFLHLIDESGGLLAQLDPPLDMDSLAATVSYSLSVPSTLPAGNIRLMGGVYDITLPGAPRILTHAGADSLLLADFQR